MQSKREHLRVLKYTGVGMGVGALVLCSLFCTAWFGNVKLAETLLTYPMVLLFAWFECLVMPFFGLTESGNSFALTSLVGILLALIVRHFVRPYPKWWPRFAMLSTFAATVLAPLTFWTALLLLRFRGSTMRGHWAQPMADDPKYISQNDPLYQRLYHGVDYACAFSGVLLYLTAALVFHLALSGNLSVRRVKWLCAVFAGGWLFFLFASPGLYLWWMD